MRKKFVLLLAATMAVCSTAGILSACNKTPEPEPQPEPGSQVFQPGDTIIEEREGEFTYDSSGHLVYEKYTAKNIDIKYLVSESSYITLTGQKPTELVISGYKGDIERLSVSDVENNIIVNDAHVAVVGVADGAFYGCETLKEVDLSKTNTSLTFSVGTGAFANCVSLKSVIIPEDNIYTTSVAVGDGAFLNNLSLTSVNLGNKLVDLGERAFYNCSALTSINIPKNISVIKSYTFADCDLLSNINVGSAANLKSIQNSAFGNTAISSLNLGSLTSLRYIGSSAFENTKLSTVSLPDSVTYIGNRAFYNCEKLTTVNVPFLGNSIAQSNTFNSIYGISGKDTRSLNVTVKTALSIPDSSFAEVTNISTLAINSFAKAGAQKVYSSDGVSFERYNLLSKKSENSNPNECAIIKTVGYGAFNNCSSLNSITLPADTEEIGGYAFSGCEALNSFTIPASVKTIGTHAFDGCEQFGSLTLPDKLQTIGSYAFKDCTALNEVTIPASVTEIGDRAFNGCDNLTKLTISQLNGVGPVYSDNDEILRYEYKALSSNVASWFDSDNRLAEITVSSLCTLPDNAFSGLKVNTVSLTFKDVDESLFGEDSQYSKPYTPESRIGEKAFYNCASLTDLTIKDESGLLNVIGNNAFSGCSQLSSFTVPATIEIIGNYAFSNCSSLTSFTVPESVNEVGYNALSGCNKLASLTVNAYDKSVSESYDNGLMPGTTNESIVSLGNIANWFGNGSNSVPASLKTVTLKNVNTLADSIFRGWSNLTTVNIEFIGTLYSGSGASAQPNFTTIGGSAFENCTKLANLTITGGENVKAINYNAFRNCEKLTDALLVKFSNVAYIGDNAFDGCKLFTKVTLPGSLVEIGYSVFANCPDIAVLNIGNYAALKLASVASLFGSDNGEFVTTNSNTNPVSIQKYVSANGTYVPVSLETITVNGIKELSDLSPNLFYNMSMVKVISLNILPETSLVCSSSDLAPFNGCTSLEKVFLPESVTAIYLEQYVSADSLAYVLGTANVYEYAENLSSYGNFWCYDEEDDEKIVINNKYEGEITYTLNLNGGEWKKDETDNDVVTVNKPLEASDIPEVAEREGYVLLGWYDNYNNRVSFPYYSKYNTTLNAKWVAEDALVVSNPGDFIVGSGSTATSGTLSSSSSYNRLTASITVQKQSTVTLTISLSTKTNYGTLYVRKGTGNYAPQLFRIDNSSYNATESLGINQWSNSTSSKTLSIDLDEGETVQIEFVKNSYGASGTARVVYSVGDRVEATLPEAPVIPEVIIPEINVSDIVGNIKGEELDAEEFNYIIGLFVNLGDNDSFAASTVLPNGYAVSEEYDYINNALKQVINYNGVEITLYYVHVGGDLFNLYYKLPAGMFDELLKQYPEYADKVAQLENKWIFMSSYSISEESFKPSFANKTHNLSSNIEDYELDESTGAYWREVASSGAYKSVLAVAVEVKDSANINSSNPFENINIHVYLSLLRYNEVYFTIEMENFNNVTVDLPEDVVDLEQLFNGWGDIEDEGNQDDNYQYNN